MTIPMPGHPLPAQTQTQTHAATGMCASENVCLLFVRTRKCVCTFLEVCTYQSLFVHMRTCSHHASVPSATSTCAGNTSSSPSNNPMHNPHDNPRHNPHIIPSQCTIIVTHPPHASP
jgi:hypothetical protein